MDATTIQFFSDLAGRLHGPLTLRFILQPLSAMIHAVRHGVKDARNDKPPCFWTMFTHPEKREALLRSGWHDEALVIGLGAIIDAVYQVIVFKWIHPVELVVIVLLLAFVPYLLLRGPINRIARRLIVRKAQPT